MLFRINSFDFCQFLWNAFSNESVLHTMAINRNKSIYFIFYYFSIRQPICNWLWLSFFLREETSGEVINIKLKINISLRFNFQTTKTHYNWLLSFFSLNFKNSTFGWKTFFWNFSFYNFWWIYKTYICF